VTVWISKFFITMQMVVGKVGSNLHLELRDSTIWFYRLLFIFTVPQTFTRCWVTEYIFYYGNCWPSNSLLDKASNS